MQTAVVPTTPRATQNPSNPVTVSNSKTQERGAPSLTIRQPVAAVESDTLSGQARRGLDRALEVVGGVRGGLGGPGRGGQGVGGGVGRWVPVRVTLGPSKAAMPSAARGHSIEA